MLNKLTSTLAKNFDEFQNAPSSTAVVPETPAPVPAASLADNPVILAQQRQAQIIAYFTGGHNPQVFITANLIEITPEQKQSFLDLLEKDKISHSELETFFRDIPSPFDNPDLDVDRVFSLIAKNRRMVQILAVACGYNQDNWQQVGAKDLRTLMSLHKKGQPDYRTPIGFSEFREKFLEDIQPASSPTQYNKYLHAFDELEAIIYGPRFDYYQQFELLRQSAHLPEHTPHYDLSPQSQAELPASSKIRTHGEDERADPVTTGVSDALRGGQITLPKSLAAAELAEERAAEQKQAEQAQIAADREVQPPQPLYSLLPPDRREQVLALSVIDGDPWRQNGQDFPLTTSSLLSADLYPQYQIILDGRPIYLSAVFATSNATAACIAYVSAKSSVKVRSFYRDKLTGLWCYLPDYIRTLDGNGIDLLGQGYHERSVILPIPLQATLSNLEQSPINITITNPDFLFAGTAKAYDTQPAYNTAKSAKQLRGDFYHEVSHTPVNADAKLIAPGHRKIAPQLLSTNAELAPDFYLPIAFYNTYTALTAHTFASAYPSNDQACNWLFLRDERSRVWVAQIEFLSPLTSTGCRHDWLAATDIETPLYEFSRLADDYGNNTDIRGGRVGMWDNYLSQVPLIQQFLKFQAQQVAKSQQAQ